MVKPAGEADQSKQEGAPGAARQPKVNTRWATRGTVCDFQKGGYLRSQVLVQTA